jgi:hypothetical protein
MSGTSWHALSLYSGSQLIEKAKQIAERLGNFKGSNGWLEKRFNVKMVKICGESGDVCGDTIDSWLERLPELVDGYRRRCFLKALPD